MENNCLFWIYLCAELIKKRTVVWIGLGLCFNVKKYPI